MQKPNIGLDFTPTQYHVIPRMHNPQIGMIHQYTAKIRIYDIAPISKTNQQKNLRQYWDYENVSPDAILWRHNQSVMADGRHVENRYIIISRQKNVPDFDEIWYTAAYLEPYDRHVTKRSIQRILAKPGRDHYDKCPLCCSSDDKKVKNQGHTKLSSWLGG